MIIFISCVLFIVASIKTKENKSKKDTPTVSRCWDYLNFRSKILQTLVKDTSASLPRANYMKRGAKSFIKANHFATLGLQYVGQGYDFKYLMYFIFSLND